MQLAHRLATLAAIGAAVTTLAACSGEQSQPAPAPAPAPAASPAQGAPAPGGGIDQNRADQIATGKYGGQVISTESDTTAGRATWEVEIANSSEGRIEVDVAKDGGAILKMEHDRG